MLLGRAGQGGGGGGGGGRCFPLCPLKAPGSLGTLIHRVLN